MPDNAEKTISCSQCQKTPCLYGYPEGLPEWCQGRRYQDIIERARAGFFEPENLRIHIAAAKVIEKGNELWPRAQETIEFAKELGVRKIGFAVCVGLIREGRELVRYFQRAGFGDMVAVGCMIGGLKSTETGVPEEYSIRYVVTCNPIAQAEILNRERTELNIMVGLCTGHDTLFLRYSKAPVTVFAVKDRAACNNPTAVLFSPFYRMRLNEVYKGK
jgi:uncharacterized metal-binding protein